VRHRNGLHHATRRAGISRGRGCGLQKDYIEFLKSHTIAPDRGTITGRAVLEGRPIQILDVSADPEYTLRESTTLAGQHTALCVPLLREGEPIGTIVLARQRVEPFTEKQIDRAFSVVAAERTDALLIFPSPMLFNQRKRIVDLAAEHRLPTMAMGKEFVQLGGLMSYGADIIDSNRRCVAYVDRILKGAKPADLPVEQPTKFELFINLKTAKTFDIEIPAALLARADGVLE